MFAAIGSDGTRLVVWGIGDTADDARNDAERSDVNPLFIEPITDKQALAIDAGDTRWPPIT